MNSEVVLGVLNRSLFAGRGIENIRVEIFGIFALFHLVNDLSWKQMNATYRFSEKKKTKLIIACSPFVDEAARKQEK